MPVLVFEENELIYVPSTMGGAGQPQIHAQLLLRMFGGASPAEAINAPRFVVREPEGPQIRVIVEADFDSIAVETMVARGYAVEVVPPHTELLGHSNMIELIGGGYRAASDPRADGSALIVSTD
jgi:gamma-glutamyltranspeptidase